MSHFRSLAALLLLTSAPLVAQVTSPELVWTLRDDGAKWIGYYVSMGNEGTQIFAHESNYAMAGVLLSRHDSDPPVPAWIVPTYPANPVSCDSARHVDAHVSLTATPTGTPNAYTLKLMTFTSQGADWTYTYPKASNQNAFVTISDDGQTIVAAIEDQQAMTREILVFDALSPVPKAIYVLPGDVLWSFTVSGNGERAIAALGTKAHVFDVATGTVFIVIPFGYSLSNVSLALSADASLLVHGEHFAGRLRAFTWLGENYSHAFYYWPQGSNPNTAIASIAISDDNSTVAFGVNEAYPSTKVQTEAFDVASQLMTMSETVSSDGAYQNSCRDVAISADGARFAVAQFGDEPDLVAEVRIFDRDNNAPLYSLNLPGSAFNVDISPDGRWVVAGSKGVHANVSGSGGRYDLIHLGGSDLRLRGTPSLGHDVSFEMHGPPGSTGTLLLSPRPLSPPLTLGVGTLYLDPALLWIVPVGQLAGDGLVTHPFRVPVNPSLVGFSAYVQGLTSTPQALTQDWIKVTLLP